MTYSEKLRDPRWQKKRLHILERDGWKCCACGAGNRNLQVHHIVYRKTDPWDYPDDIYQTLCDECHKFRGKVLDSVADNLKLKAKDFLSDDLAFFAYFMGCCVEAFARSKAGLGMLENGLFQDVVMDICSAQNYHSDPSQKGRPKSTNTLRMATEVLERSAQ